MPKAATLHPPAETLARIETMLEQIYDAVQEIREEHNPNWFTTEIQEQVKEAQAEVERGEYEVFDSADDLITHLHAVAQAHEHTLDNTHIQ